MTKTYTNVFILCLLQFISSCKESTLNYKYFITADVLACQANEDGMSFQTYLDDHVTSVEDYNYSLDQYIRYLNDNSYESVSIDPSELQSKCDANSKAYLCVVPRRNHQMINSISNYSGLLP